jgi:hypothetical protein
MVISTLQLSNLPCLQVFDLLLCFMSCLLDSVLIVMSLRISTSLTPFFLHFRISLSFGSQQHSWITFWRQYVTGGPPGSLPGARLVFDTTYTHASCLTRTPPLTRAMEHNETTRIVRSLFRAFITTSRALWHHCQCVLVAFVIKVSYRSHYLHWL